MKYLIFIKTRNLRWKFIINYIDFGLPGGGTAVTALQTAQHTEVAPTG